MRRYEALILFRTAGTEQDLSRAATAAEESVKKLEGRVDGSQGMGRRRLAYRIARQAEGHYHLLRLSLPPTQLGELDRLWRLQESILRFMVLSEDELPAAPTETLGTRQPMNARERSW